MKDTVDVLIVGGGSAGISAARRLAEARVDYLLVEARARLGGRAWTVDGAIDMGCGWLHSADTNPWARIAEREGWTLDKSPPPWTKPASRNDMGADDRAEFGQVMGDFYERLHAEIDKPDRPASALLPDHGRWNALMNAISGYINGAELDKVSARDFAHYEDTGVNWRVTDGYGALVTANAEGLNAVLDCPVSEIDHGGPTLRVVTPRGVIHAKAVIVTVSSAIIAEERLRFTPGLPAKVEAAQGLPLGLADKLFLHLDQAEELEIDSRVYGHTNVAGTAAYHMRPFGRPQIEVYFGGSLADDLERQGGHAFTEFAMQELCSLMGSSFGARLQPIRLSQWRNDPLARGSYSYAKPGHHGDRVLLAAPVENRLFFAGEACSIPSYSTCHGAYITGQDAALQAIAALGG